MKLWNQATVIRVGAGVIPKNFLLTNAVPDSFSPIVVRWRGTVLLVCHRQ